MATMLEQAMQPSVTTSDRRRVAFIRRTYAHLLGGILALVAFEVALFRTGIAAKLASAARDIPWILILGGFLAAAWLASRMAWRLKTTALQYLGMGLYIVAKGLILIPLLYRAENLAPGLIEQAAQITLLGTVGLTVVAFTSGTDFSFLRSLLVWGGMAALILIVAALSFGLHLGIWFSVGMIVLAGGSILYDTQKIARNHRGQRHVGAALSLLASVGMMFWYVLRIVTRAGRP